MFSMDWSHTAVFTGFTDAPAVTERVNAALVGRAAEGGE